MDRHSIEMKLEAALSNVSSQISQSEQYIRAVAPPCLEPVIGWFLDQGEEGSYRKKARGVLSSVWFDIAVGAVICFNIFLVIHEVDAHADDSEPPAWVVMFNHILLVVYVVEIIFRFYVQRIHFFHDRFSLLDLLLVSYDVINQCLGDMSNASILRIGRLAKVTRTFKFLQTVPELHLMMKGIKGALKSIFWGTVLSFVLILIWSILAVSLIHPIVKEMAEHTDKFEGCDRCKIAYRSVFDSVLTICQTIVAGDAWGEVHVPIIERRPSTAWFFFFCFATLSLALMNLILAMIVDAAQQARQKSLHDLAREKEFDYAKAKRKLEDLCSALDTDKSGLLSLQELEDGFKGNPAFGNALKVLEIREEDMPVLFGIMDYDGSGEVSYNEFVKELWKMQSNDMQSMVAKIKALRSIEPVTMQATILAYSFEGSLNSKVVNIRFYLTQIRKQLQSVRKSFLIPLWTRVLEQMVATGETILQRISRQEDDATKKLESVLTKSFEEDTKLLLASEEKMLKENAKTVKAPGLKLPDSASPPQAKDCNDTDASQGILSKLTAIERTCNDHLAETLTILNASVLELTSRLALERGEEVAASLTKGLQRPGSIPPAVSRKFAATPMTPQPVAERSSSHHWFITEARHHEASESKAESRSRLLKLDGFSIRISNSVICLACTAADNA